MNINEKLSEETQEQSCKAVLCNGFLCITDNNNVLAYKKMGLITQMSYHARLTLKVYFSMVGFGTWLNQHSQVTHWMYMPDHLLHNGHGYHKAALNR
jgi:hypothetical protein